MAIVALLLLFASTQSAHSEDDLPGIAFGWAFALDVIRAAVVFAVIAVVVMVLLRGWGGIWPQRISTSGIDYPELSRGLLDLHEGQDKLDELKAELEKERDD